MRLWEGIEDRRVWLGEEEGFSVKSMVTDLSTEAAPVSVPFFDTVWKSSIPNKVQIFAWQLALKRVNTADGIQRLNPHISLMPSLCPLCVKACEDGEHLFLECPVAEAAWKWLFHKLGLFSVPDTIAGLLCIHESQGFNSKWVAAAKVGVLSSLWCLWTERNKRIFNEEKEHGGTD